MSSETAQPLDEAMQRKKRSERLLKAEGVPFVAHLPAIETAAEAKFRSKDAIVDRAIALLVVGLKGEGMDQESVLQIAKELEAKLTPKERAFLEEANPDKGTRVQFSWQYECLAVMLWALGFTPELGRPDHIVDVPHIARLMKEKAPQRLRDVARMRSPAELLDAADLIYRYNWACVDARVNGKPGEPEPAGLDCGVVLERHRALNWLIGYQGQPWDEVSTDT